MEPRQTALVQEMGIAYHQPGDVNGENTVAADELGNAINQQNSRQRQNRI